MNAWLAVIAKPLKHGGNLRYIWALDRSVRIYGPHRKYPTWEELGLARPAPRSIA